MAAPAAAEKLSYRFRDAKGNTARTTFIIGDASEAAVMADYDAGVALLQAVSNASVGEVTSPNKTVFYGTNAEFPNVEDGCIIVMRDPQGSRHSFKVAAPKLSMFLADGETMNASNGAVAALLTWIETFCFGQQTDTAALAFVGGYRLRKKLHRKISIFTKSAGLDEPSP